VDSGGTTKEVQQQQGSASRVSTTDRYSIPILHINNRVFSNLFYFVFRTCGWGQGKKRYADVNEEQNLIFVYAMWIPPWIMNLKEIVFGFD
jgi:hypothetical protein